MKIYYFSYNTTAPSLRYRGKYLLEKIKQGYDIKYYIFGPDYIYMPLVIFIYFILLFKKNKNDIFIFQKICNDTFYSKLLLKILDRTEHSVYDIDDAMYVLKKSSVIKKFIKRSEKIIVGSDSLKKYCLKLNSNTILLTTPLPKSNKIKEGKNATFTVGWVGIYSVHKENLFSILFPVLLKINHPIQLTMLGVDSKSKEELELYFSKNNHLTLNIIADINWDDEDEINAHIATFDIGVMPLLNNELNKGKSAFKIKQYINCGVPALASPVGENIKYIKNDLNGFLCNSNKEWLDKITFFQNMPPEKFDSYIKNSLDYYNQSPFSEERAVKLLLEILNLKLQ